MHWTLKNDNFLPQSIERGKQILEHIYQNLRNCISCTDVEYLNECVDNCCCVTVLQTHYFKRKPVLSGIKQVISIFIIFFVLLQFEDLI